MRDLGDADLLGLTLGAPFSAFTERFPGAEVDALPMPHAEAVDPLGPGSRVIGWADAAGRLSELCLFLADADSAAVDAALTARHGAGDEASANIGGVDQEYLMWLDAARANVEIVRTRYTDAGGPTVKIVWQAS